MPKLHICPYNHFRFLTSLIIHVIIEGVYVKFITSIGFCKIKAWEIFFKGKNKH